MWANGHSGVPGNKVAGLLGKVSYIFY